MEFQDVFAGAKIHNKFRDGVESKLAVYRPLVDQVAVDGDADFVRTGQRGALSADVKRERTRRADGQPTHAVAPAQPIDALGLASVPAPDKTHATIAAAALLD